MNRRERDYPPATHARRSSNWVEASLEFHLPRFPSDSGVGEGSHRKGRKEESSYVEGGGRGNSQSGTKSIRDKWTFQGDANLIKLHNNIEEKKVR